MVDPAKKPSPVLDADHQCPACGSTVSVPVTVEMDWLPGPGWYCAMCGTHELKPEQ